MYRFLKSVVFAGLFLIPIIPLVVVDSWFFPYITGKGFLFRILVEIIFGAWLILAFLNSNYRPKKSWILYSLISFVGIIAVADIFGENFTRSFWSNFERMEGLVILLHLLGYFLVLISFFKKEKLWQRFFQVNIGVSVVVGLHGILQLIGKAEMAQGGVRLDSTFGNASYLAVYMLINIFLAGLLLVRRNREKVISGWEKMVYIFVIVLNLIVLYNTATRGAILGLIGGSLLVAMLIAIFEKDKKRLRRGAIIGIATVLLIVMGFLLIKNTTFVKNSPVLNRIALISLEEKTTRARFLLWGVGLEGFKEKPILGWGQENFNLVFNKNYDSRMYDQEQWFDRAHNVVLDWLIAGGVLGCLAYLSLFFVTLWFLWFRKNSLAVAEKSILTGLLSAYFFNNLFVFDNTMSYIMFVSVLGYVHFMSVEEGEVSSGKKIVWSELSKNIIIALILILTLASLYFVNMKGMRTARGVLVSLIPHQIGLTGNLANVEKTFSWKPSLGREELIEQTLLLADKIDFQKEEEDTVQRYFSISKNEMLKLIEDSPPNARLEYFMGVFLRKFGQFDEAVKYFDNALAISLRKPSFFIDKAVVYLMQEDFDSALKILKQGFDIEPENKNLIGTYALVAIYAQNWQLTEELLVPAFGTLAVPQERFAKVYSSVGRYDLSAQVWENLIAVSKPTAMYHAYLAPEYVQLGRYEDAIFELEKAIEIDPAFKEKGEVYINEIKSQHGV